MRYPISSASKTNTLIPPATEKNQKAKNTAARNGREIETVSGKTLWARVKTKAHDLAQGVRIKIDATKSHKVVNPKYCVAKNPVATTPSNPLLNINPSAQMFKAPAETQAPEPQQLANPGSSPAPTPSAQRVIQDIDLELATQPLPCAAAPQASVNASEPVNDKAKTEATRYVAAESKAPAYKALKKKITLELDVTRLKYATLFLTALNQPVEERRYSVTLENLDRDYDAAYNLAFDEQYIVARQNGRSESAAFMFAAETASLSVFIDFQASVDPARNAYAKVMDKFQTKIALTSAQVKTFSVAFVLATENPNKPATPEAAPDTTKSAKPRVVVTMPKTILPSDHVTLKAIGSEAFAVLAKAPAKTPRLPARPESEGTAMRSRSDSYSAAMKNPIEPAIREEVIARETSLPATSRTPKKPRSFASLVTSPKKPSVNTALKATANFLLRRNRKSVDLPTLTNVVAQSNATAGTNVPGLNAYRTDKNIQVESKNTDKNVQLRSYIQTGNE